MMELFGVLTAALLNCGSIGQTCLGAVDTAAFATVEVAPAAAVPMPAAKPRNLKSASVKPSKPSKHKIELVMDVEPAQKPARRKQVPLLIGNYY